MPIGDGSRVRRRHSGLLVAGILTLTALAATPSAQAVFPPGTNGRISFDRLLDGAQEDIFTMNPNGSAQTNVTNTPALVAPASEFTSAFSPDGSQIAFARSDGSQTDVWIANDDGSGGVNLTNTPAPLNDSLPAFSPDGRRIAFTRFEGGQSDIWAMNANGSGQVNLTNTPAPVNEAGADFSPDGLRIAFARRSAPGPFRIHTMNANGTGATIVSSVATGAIGDELGGFSPDGTRIVFARDQQNIFVMNINGSGQVNLTNQAPPFYNFAPIFSPDGRLISFHRTDGASDDVWVMNVNGSGQTNLTPTPTPVEEEGQGSWESIQSCGGRPAGIIGDDGADKITGTKRADVIDANAGKNVVSSGAGNDTICLGTGKARVNCGPGRRDKVIGIGKGKKKQVGCERTKGRAFR